MSKPDYLQKRSWGFVAIARNPENGDLLCIEKFVQNLDEAEFVWRAVPAENSPKRFSILAPLPEMTVDDFFEAVSSTGSLPDEVTVLYPNCEVKSIDRLLNWRKTGEYLVASMPVEMSFQELKAYLRANGLQEGTRISERYASGWGEISYVVLYDYDAYYWEKSSRLRDYAETLVKNGAVVWENWDSDRGLKLALPRRSNALSLVRERTQRERAILMARLEEGTTGDNQSGLLIGMFKASQKTTTVSIP